ncbi:uncharacterized protein C8A04DRAFT_10577 [Dichotomopilus funicola]|uniref:PNPLA domain-containing protein n=1 Tax=Dichotomopilus funicola TaxID=1934379 RepID=A0AAN6V7G6_9PEZI|nr:hypothetical protein C8A04DRAFT_10577 [Dichotomopilus funicola]
MAFEEDEAINLLSLDGGGVRGVSSLLILDEIMNRIKEQYGLDEVPKPCDYFHMIAGTSTGGLIAIMLGRLRMSTKEALQEYDNCAAQIFRLGNRKWSLSERFRSAALQAAVEGIVKRRGLGELMRDAQRHKKGKTIVCVMPSKLIEKPRVVRSFAGDPGERHWDANITIWQAARATTAASSFFKPQKLGGEGDDIEQTYIDAAIGANNPVGYLLDEAVLEFGAGRRLGCVISIGTGTRLLEVGRVMTGIRNFLLAPSWYIQLIKTLKAKATDAEEAHRQLELRLAPFPGSYFRFNVPDAAAKVGLHHYKRMPTLKSLTKAYLADKKVNAQVSQIAELLKTDGFEHGLVLGHLSIDKEQVILSTSFRQMAPSSSFFTGRQDILTAMDLLFSPRHTGGSPRRECLLYGAPGVGKSEIARKASEMFDRRFKYIFFIDGTMGSSIRYSYSQIAKKYNLGSGSPEVMQRLAMNWIEELTDEWLMIFDDCNMENRHSNLPGRSRGNIIYTTRLTTLTYSLTAGSIFEITELGTQDAVELLLKAAGLPETTISDADRALARTIVKELGGLPLAIGTAAASIRDGMTLSGFLTLHRERKVRVLHDPRFEDNIENATVYAVFEVSYDALKARQRRGGRQLSGRIARSAAKLLSLLAFYHTRDFPLSALGRAAQERQKRNAHMAYPLSGILEPPDIDLEILFGCVNEEGRWDSAWVSAALNLLETLSLVKVNHDQDSVSMHNLVHSWARIRLEKDLFQRYSLIAQIIISESIVLSPKWRDKADALSVGPHARVCFKHPSKDLRHDQYQAQMQLKRAWMYQLNKKFDKAEMLYAECLRYWKVEHGNDSWSVVNILNRMAMMYHEMGRLGDAELTYLELINKLDTRLKDFDGPPPKRPVQDPADEPKTGHRDPDGTYSPTRPHDSPALSIQNQQRMRRRVANAFESVLHGDSSKHGKSLEGNPPTVLEPEWPRLIESRRPKAPEDPDEILAVLCVHHADLAKVYIDQDREGMGVRMLLQAARRLEALLPPDSPELQRVQNEAMALTEPGNLKFWKKRMEEIENNLEPGSDFMESDTVWPVFVFLADCLLKNRGYRFAYERYCDALTLFERVHGPNDKRVLQILRHMVVCTVDSGDCDLGVKIARDCLKRAKLAYGECHQETVYYSLKKSVEQAEATFGKDHVITKTYARYLGPAPTRTLEEEFERLLAAFGPHNQLTISRHEELMSQRGPFDEPVYQKAAPIPVIGYCACGSQLHAEGSRENEAFVWELEGFEFNDWKTEDSGVAFGDELNSVPNTPGKTVDRTKGNVGDRWRNRPVFKCGLF